MSRLPEPIEWLAAGIPLTLLIDVLAPSAPDSAEIFTSEAGEAWWLQKTTHAA